MIQMTSINNPMDECIIVIFKCLFLSVVYVGSLYIWKTRHERDHPSTIKRRFVSVSVVALASPFYLYFCLNPKYLEEYTLWELLGLRIAGLWQAAIYPLALTVILFLGPLYLQHSVSSHAECNTDDGHWAADCWNLVWLRNHLVAPFSEELTYRACMVPLLLQCFSQLPTIFICPVFFGTAHFNHLLENLKSGLGLKTSVCISSFQFLYTTIFGAYSTFLFLRTGHLVAPIFAHIFCNHMGFPDVSGLVSLSNLKRLCTISLFFIGFGIWCVLLMPATEPHLYYNTIYWNQNYSSIKFS